MKKILSKMLGGALLLGLTMSLTSCEDILGEWSKPTPNPITPGGGGLSTINVTDITLDATLSINIGEVDVALTAIVAPDNATDKTVTWSSDNTAAATVDETGKVHAVAAGTAKITAKAGDKEAVCNVTVTAYTLAANAASADKGKLICTGGHIHAYGEDAECTKDRVAKIIYVGNDAETSTTYNHGLALALKDEWNDIWCSQKSETCLGTGHQFSSADDAKTDMAGIANTNALINDAPSGHTHGAAIKARNYNDGTYPRGTSVWFLPSAGQWQKMIDANGLSNLTTSTPDGFTGLKSGTSDYYLSSTENNYYNGWRFNFSDGACTTGTKDISRKVRACLAF